jgi:plastocyanin
MKRRITIAIMILAALTWASFRVRLAPAEDSHLDVSGEVTLLPQEGGALEKDASRVVEWLVPAIQDPASARNDAGKYQMVQREKRFEPDMLVVPVGSSVTFPNRDPWFHNVFSLYRGKRFDLGLYQAGDSKVVRFDRVGPSYIFCNIHPQMAAVILTVDSKYYGVTDKGGHTTISGVPAGKYRMHVWYENADADALEALTRDVSVGEDRSLPSITIGVVEHDLRQHKNKYGKDYDSDALAPTY